MADEIVNSTPIAPIPVESPTPVSETDTVLPVTQTEETETEEIKTEETDDNSQSDYKSLIPQENYLSSPLFYEVANYFGVEDHEYAESVDKLSLIVDWAINTTKSNKLEDILVEVRKLENKMSPPSWGERRFKNVYRYLRLATKRDAFNKALSAYEKGLV